MFAALPVELQRYACVHAEGCPARNAGDLDNMQVIAVGDTEWLSALDLANWEDLAHKLYTWATQELSDDDDGVIVLRGPERANPLMPIMDQTCPTLLVYGALEQKGWTPVRGVVELTLQNYRGKRFDGRLAIKHKTYFQVCHAVDTCIRLTSSIPSQQVIKFYQCLLKGLKVEPNMPDKHYAAILDDKRRASGALPILDIDDPPPSPPRPLRADDDDAIMGADVPAPKAQPRRRGDAGGGTTAHPHPAVPPGFRLSPAPLPPGGGRRRDGPPRPDPLPVPPPAPPPDPPGTPPAEEPPPDDADDAIMGEDAQPARPARTGPAVEAGQWTDSVDGILVKYEVYHPPEGGSYPNWIIQSQEYAGRTRSRKVCDAFSSIHGRVEPLAYLHCKIARESRGLKPGAATNPTAAEVAAFVALHRPQLEEVCDRFIV